MVFVQPEKGAAEKEAADLMPAVVKDIAVPVGVKSFLRVGMLVKVSAVEEFQAVFIVGKMRRHPVQNDADAFWCR